MSRLARKPIPIPVGVSAGKEGALWVFKGPKGELKKRFPAIILIDEISSESGDKALKISLDTKKSRRVKNSAALLGTVAALVKNCLTGVTEGFEKKLGIEGVGYKAQLDGNDLNLSLGFSHPVKVKATDGISFKVEKNLIYVNGIDKEAVGKIAAVVRSQKKPEPYKGKGIHYEGEVIRRKAGKKAAATA